MIISKKLNSSKHQYKAEFKNLYDCEVLSSDFSGLNPILHDLKNNFTTRPWAFLSISNKYTELV